MEEQVTWKAHSFTLFVFTGIVVLCSIFFILGMLVGRAQGQKFASSPAPAPAIKADAKPAPKEEKQDFTFYDSVKKEQPLVLQPAPAKPEPPPHQEPVVKADPPPEPPSRVTAKRANVLNYQIGAVKTSADAEKLLQGVKKKGFRAFILAPAADDANPFFRVLVGPFSDPIAAREARDKLEEAGYKKPLLKK